MLFASPLLSVLVYCYLVTTCQHLLFTLVWLTTWVMGLRQSQVMTWSKHNMNFLNKLSIWFLRVNNPTYVHRFMYSGFWVCEVSIIIMTMLSQQILVTKLDHSANYRLPLPWNGMYCMLTLFICWKLIATFQLVCVCLCVCVCVCVYVCVCVCVCFLKHCNAQSAYIMIVMLAPPYRYVLLIICASLCVMPVFCS